MSELHIHIHPDSAVLAALQQFKEQMIMNFQEAVDAVNAQTALLQKIGGETSSLLQKVTDLQTVIDSMQQQGQTVPQELVDALAALSTQATAVDNLVPDVPTP